MKLTAFIAALFLSASAFAQTSVDKIYGIDRTATLRAASGSLSAAETTTAVIGLHVFSEAVVYLNITTATLADADDEVDFYLQTTYDGGTTWTDLSCIHLANGDNGSPQKSVILVGRAANGIAQAEDTTDGTLADDTNVDYPIGTQLRIKTKITGATAPTYAYTATAFFRE